MKKAVTLDEFVAAFTDVMNELCSADTWLFKELGLDDDELDWMFNEMALAGYRCPVRFTGDPLKYLPSHEKWPFGRKCSDLTIRELYAFSEFEGDG